MIPHNKPSIGPEESEAIAEVIASGWIAPGEKVRQFEQAFADYVGAKYAVAVNSGTAALTIALKILGRMYFIAMPTYICSAVLNAVDMCNEQAYIIDISRNDFNMERVKVELSPHKGVYIISHTFGVPADIKQFTGENQYIIEDCAQALGSYIDGKHVDLQGDIGIFSFGPSKMITTGSGGMLVTNNKDLADKARNYIDFDQREDYKPRFNFAMNDLQAAMGLVQLKRLPIFLYKKARMAYEYRDICKSKGWDNNKGMITGNNFYRFVVINDCVDRLKQRLADNEITAIVPIERRELLHNYLGLDAGDYPNAEWVSTHTLSLPIYPDLLDSEFSKIIEILRRF
jgi:perosamine synthetase